VTRVARRRLSARIRSIVRSSQFLESLGATAVAGEFDPLAEFHDLDCANTHWTATLRTGQHSPSPVTATLKPPWGPPSDRARKPQRRARKMTDRTLAPSLQISAIFGIAAGAFLSRP